ncbi:MULTISPECIES: sensor histidine kinase [Niastella]|uniref:Histidine kinase n=1 Tax=Niastella soli TaxID=2821487 RepID=A0ABS3Z026_9BACT|nr:histidine kinase [Niastella soli]MBO9203534.1 histidine kinase [Niastella soli]
MRVRPVLFHIKPGIIISLSIGCFFVLRFLIPLQSRVADERLVQWTEGDLGEFLFTFAVISFFSFICWLIHQYIRQTHFRIKAFQYEWVKGVSGVLLCMLISYSIGRLQLYIYNAHGAIPPLRRFFFLGIRGLSIGGFQYFMVFYTAAIKRVAHSKIEIEQLKKENLQTRLNLLKQQISPHFLFNSLSTLKTIATDQNTRQYIMQLSNVYRYLLNYNDNNVASLQDELAFTNSYLYILKERFEDALQVHILVAEELLSLYIPPLSLQILIENAIKHNVIAPGQPLHIYIYTDGNHTLTVENNIQPKLSMEKHTGKGLKNINDRLRLLSGKQLDITNTGTKFIVKLPLLQYERIDH